MGQSGAGSGSTAKMRRPFPASGVHARGKPKPCFQGPKHTVSAGPLDLQLTTLYVMTEGAYLHRDGLALKVEVEKKEKLRVPVHHLESVVVFDQVMVSPSAMGLLAEQGVSVTF